MSLIRIGCLVPFNEPRLLNQSRSVDAAASPSFIPIENGRIRSLASLMNAIILMAMLSMLTVPYMLVLVVLFP